MTINNGKLVLNGLLNSAEATDSLVTSRRVLHEFVLKSNSARYFLSKVGIEYIVLYTRGDGYIRYVYSGPNHTSIQDAVGHAVGLPSLHSLYKWIEIEPEVVRLFLREVHGLKNSIIIANYDSLCSMVNYNNDHQYNN